MKTGSNGRFLKQLMLASIFAAMTTVLTYYLKIPMHNGYMHLGDSMIYLCACFLPTPLAMVSAGIGGMLADLFGGYTVYMIPTFIIKAMLVPAFDNRSSKIITKRNCLAVPAAALITVLGYYVADVVVASAGSASGISDFFGYIADGKIWIAMLSGMPGNVMQAAASAAVFFILAAAMDKTQVKNKLL